jgi:hypothetical protein
VTRLDRNMTEEEYLTKSQAEAIIGMETGAGRVIIQRALDTLIAQGRITFEPGLDGRSRIISRSDVNIVIAYIKARI